jgi:large subunit ribosomal protein L23
MKQAQTIIKRMLLTEKSTRLTEHGNHYVFEVYPHTNKLEIKRAVEQLFKVNVTKVNTLNRKSVATSGRRYRPGHTSASKRAIVTLKAGQKIDLT